MIFRNPNSRRSNPFRQIYDSEEFKNVLAKRDNRCKFPYLVDVELANHCNLNCIFCGQQSMKRPKGFMTDDILKNVADECAIYDAPIRFIRWGEPFLHPKIIDFCEYVKSKGVLLHVTTNGLAMKESDMRAVADLAVDSLAFSFQGTTKEEYEIMRNNRLYDKLCLNIKRMVEIRQDREKPFIHISSTVTDEPEEKIRDFGNYWADVADSVGIGRTNLSRVSIQQIKSLEIRGKLEALKKRETVKKQYKPCTEVYQKLSVDWDGKVSCCCGDYDNYLVVGDANKSSLFDIWNGSRSLKIFRELLDDNMHHCLTLCSTCYPTYEEF